ncbi:hypothetical protein BASA81_000596 [Batrachochytrium salamandrivorans]|nr:hypothetical protein BASA81_000596 [Batrachochytrium salamandrivorans]
MMRVNRLAANYVLKGTTKPVHEKIDDWIMDLSTHPHDRDPDPDPSVSDLAAYYKLFLRTFKPEEKDKPRLWICARGEKDLSLLKQQEKETLTQYHAAREPPDPERTKSAGRAARRQPGHVLPAKNLEQQSAAFHARQEPVRPAPGDHGRVPNVGQQTAQPSSELRPPRQAAGTAPVLPLRVQQDREAGVGDECIYFREMKLKVQNMERTAAATKQYPPQALQEDRQRLLQF